MIGIYVPRNAEGQKIVEKSENVEIIQIKQFKKVRAREIFYGQNGRLKFEDTDAQAIILGQDGRLKEVKLKWLEAVS